MINEVTVEVIVGMMSKGKEKLASARRELSGGYAEEAASRSYYAVFHAVSAVLASKGLSFSSHAQVLGAFNREFVKTGVFPSNTTKKLHRLFEDRQVADYDWVNSIEFVDASIDVDDAENVVMACDEYLSRHIPGYI